jgi:hypothetical protein
MSPMIQVGDQRHNHIAQRRGAAVRRVVSAARRPAADLQASSAALAGT